MGQYTDKENLNKLLSFLQRDVLSLSANLWFAKELYKRLGALLDARNTDRDKKIDDIHELCIESIIKEQAEDFYKNFAIPDIREQLVKDFVKMEHWRRKNNIQEFCMALYQQIEAVTNCLGSDEDLNHIWRKIRDKKFFVDYKEKDISKRYEKSDLIIKDEIYKKNNYKKNGVIYDPDLRELMAMDKFKAILFLIVYNTEVSPSNYKHFCNKFWAGYNVYQIRNLNHRSNPKEQNNRLHQQQRDIIDHPTLSMCSLSGFLSHFISGINEHYPISPELYKFAGIEIEHIN